MLFAALFLLMLTGCATKQCPRVPVFFPPPPDEPRIQFLTGINSTDDIGDTTKKNQSTFSWIITGAEAPDIIKKLGKADGLTAYKGKLYIPEGMYARFSIVDPVKGTIEQPPGLQSKQGGLVYPVSIALDEEGYMYVADTGRKEIVVYDPAGNYARAFGRDIDPKSKIVGVAVHNGKLYALDYGTSRIRVLDRKTGEQTAVLGYSEQPNQSIRSPYALTFDDAGNIYVTNIGNSKVMKYDLDGNFLGAFGGFGDIVGKFSKPKGIAVDDAGHIWVVDGGTNIVQVFNEQFHPLTFFGWPGLTCGSLNSPSGIVVTKDNLDYFRKYAVPGFQVESLIFVVSQFGQEFCIPRITVYGLGRMESKAPETTGGKQDAAPGK